MWPIISNILVCIVCNETNTLDLHFCWLQWHRCFIYWTQSLVKNLCYWFRISINDKCEETKFTNRRCVWLCCECKFYHRYMYSNRCGVHESFCQCILFNAKASTDQHKRRIVVLKFSVCVCDDMRFESFAFTK